MQSTRAFTGTALAQRAFSRTDLLIVLGVVVIIGLIALSFPLMARAKEKAKRANAPTTNGKLEAGNYPEALFREPRQAWKKEKADVR